MKKLIFLLSFTFVLSFTKSQTFRRFEIYRSSKDVPDRPHVIDSVVKYGYANNKKMAYTTISGKVFFLNHDTCWGERDNFGYLHRNTWNGSITVLNTNYIVIYSSRGGKGTVFYFSKDFNSEVYGLLRWNILNVYKDNKCFIEAFKKKYKWYNISPDWKSVLDLYKQCNDK